MRQVDVDITAAIQKARSSKKVRMVRSTKFNQSLINLLTNVICDAQDSPVSIQAVVKSIEPIR